MCLVLIMITVDAKQKTAHSYLDRHGTFITVCCIDPTYKAKCLKHTYWVMAQFYINFIPTDLPHKNNFVIGFREIESIMKIKISYHSGKPSRANLLVHIHSGLR